MRMSINLNERQVCKMSKRVMNGRKFSEFEHGIEFIRTFSYRLPLELI
jgi:hypothetical protein